MGGIANVYLVYYLNGLFAIYQTPRNAGIHNGKGALDYKIPPFG